MDPKYEKMSTQKIFVLIIGDIYVLSKGFEGQKMWTLFELKLIFTQYDFPQWEYFRVTHFTLD